MKIPSTEKYVELPELLTDYCLMYKLVPTILENDLAVSTKIEHVHSL